MNGGVLSLFNDRDTVKDVNGEINIIMTIDKRFDLIYFNTINGSWEMIGG